MYKVERTACSVGIYALHIYMYMIYMIGVYDIHAYWIPARKGIVNERKSQHKNQSRSDVQGICCSQDEHKLKRCGASRAIYEHRAYMLQFMLIFYSQTCFEPRCLPRNVDRCKI